MSPWAEAEAVGDAAAEGGAPAVEVAEDAVPVGRVPPVVLHQ